MTSDLVDDRVSAGISLSKAARHGFAMRRMVAKYVDVCLFVVPAMLGTALLLVLFSSRTVAEFSINAMGLWFVGIYLLLAWADAVCISLFATTPGKALCSLAIRDRSGTNLSFGNAFRRALRMTTFGQAFGLPLFSVVSHAMAYHSIVSTGRTSWDRDVLVEINSFSGRKKMTIALVLTFILVPLLFQIMSYMVSTLQPANSAFVR